jgi:hypothetical protein
MRQCLKPRHLQPKRLPSGSGTDLDAGGVGGVESGGIQRRVQLPLLLTAADPAEEAEPIENQTA